ncbi:unnamed protein product [Spodoptera littoralis]|uniref:C-type lectin domain-containing protein n=1 Tax=Spodoptera littoralis TaxID=7109 RepID=A0A9P0I5V0_SPOLI|nr:unnamed protein product [Spodoptera littoralis]CAH1641629.1 unnamed protein product [Spodoptera littoralis]
MKTGVTCSVIWLFTLICYTEASSFRCDYKYSSKAKGWFKHFVVPATWADARLCCTLEGAILASPLNADIEAEIKHIIQNFFTAKSEIFTGLHATSSHGDFYTIDGVPLSAISLAWAKNEPNNAKNNEHCITFDGNGKAADRSCHETRPYICFRSGDLKTEANECGTIDPDYHLDARTGSCYKFHTVPRTFGRAHFACSAEGGHLAIINSDVEATVLKELYAKYPNETMIGTFGKDAAFIGFAAWDEHGQWTTIHGKTLDEAGYSKFSPGEPKHSANEEFCGSMYRSGLLNDLWCSKPAPFICEKQPNYHPVCRVT